ncbi:hypothetical protein ACS0TY_030250 [Phlomoides rotata]
MSYGTTSEPMWADEEGTIRIDANEKNDTLRPPLCLIINVLTGKPLNAYDFLKTMKKVMKPANRSTAKEVGHNLFSFQFRSKADLRDVLTMEPWHFDKHLLVLKELDMGEQPSTSQLQHTPFWICLYDLPMAARTMAHVSAIASRCGDMMEINRASLDGFSRSVRRDGRDESDDEWTTSGHITGDTGEMEEVSKAVEMVTIAETSIREKQKKNLDNPM